MKKIVIIGAGIGGLTTAIALQKEGFEVEVYEAAPLLKPVGAGIVLAANALNVLDKMGVVETVKSQAKMLKDFWVTDADEKVVQQVEVANIHHKAIGIHRARLQNALLQFIPSNKLFLNKKCVDIQQDDKVTVSFEDGTTVIADAVIGADGIHSVVRKNILGEIPLRYSGQSCWRGIAKLHLKGKYENNAFEMWGSEKGLRFGFLQIFNDEVYWFAVEKMPAHQKDTELDLKQMLTSKYQNFPSIVKEIIENTENERIIKHDLFDFSPIPTWYKGKIALLGDAAHATTPNMGQGGAQAIEDALAISRIMAENPDIEKAFATYNKVRYPKASRVVNTSFQLARLTNLEGKFLTNMRNFLLRITPKSIAAKQVAWLFEE